LVASLPKILGSENIFPRPKLSPPSSAAGRTNPNEIDGIRTDDIGVTNLWRLVLLSGPSSMQGCPQASIPPHMQRSPRHIGARRVRRHLSLHTLSTMSGSLSRTEAARKWAGRVCVPLETYLIGIIQCSIPLFLSSFCSAPIGIQHMVLRVERDGLCE
jgi:hypothetical protein